MNLISLLAALAIGALGGSLVVSLQSRRRESERLTKARGNARTHLRDAIIEARNDISDALALANRSIGIYSSHEAWLFVGLLELHRNNYSEALWAFRESRHAAGYGPGDCGSLQESRNADIPMRRQPDLGAHAFEREAVSAAYDLSWGYAWSTATEALYLCESGRIPNLCFGCENIQYRLHLVRLVAGVNESQSNEHCGKYILDDADSLLHEGMIGLADPVWHTEAEKACMSVLNIDDPADCVEAVNTWWLRISEKQRAIEAQRLEAEIDFVEQFFEKPFNEQEDESPWPA